MGGRGFTAFTLYIAWEEAFNFSCDDMPFFRREIEGEIKNELTTGISEMSNLPASTNSAAEGKSEKKRKTATRGTSPSLQGTSHENVKLDTRVVGCKILKFSNPPRRNLCFSNAVASVLMNIPAFIAGLQENELAENPILIELKRLFDLKNESRSSTLTFRKIIEDACLQNGQLLRSFNDNDQHDAAEFLTSVFEHLAKMDPSPVKITERVFGGLSQTTMFCSNSNCNISEQLNMEILSEIIPVSIVGCKHSQYCHCVNTLETCLEAFFNPEEMERKCQNCGVQHSTKATTFIREPETLIIQLIRFRYSQTEQRVIKIHRPIIFPTELQLPSGSKYKIVSTINHIGDSAEAGHYTCLLMDKDLGSYCLIDDGSVYTSVTVDKELNEQVYILVYAK